jgi:hypothetical protein
MTQPIPLRSGAQLLPSPAPLLRTHDMHRPDLALRRGDIVRVHRGVYAPAIAWQALAPWDRYLARVHAVALLMPDAVFALESAAALRGIPLVGEAAEVHVLRGADGTSRHAERVRVHTCRSGVEVTGEGGILTTGPIETAVALARVRNPALGLSVADATLRAHPALTTEILVAHNELAPSSRGRRLARWALHRADPRAETTLESLSRAAIEWLGFAAPEVQWLVRGVGAVVDRADFAWPDVDAVGEADGLLKYDGRFGDPVRAVQDEKRREDRIRRRVRGFARWGWADVREPERLGAILDAAGVRRERAPDALALHALARVLR